MLPSKMRFRMVVSLCQPLTPSSTVICICASMLMSMRAGLHELTSPSSSDHIGDLSDFPPSTAVLLGPFSDRSKVEDRNQLTKALQVPGETLSGRQISHLDASSRWQPCGSFRGVDHFGDGSLILLDTPGVSDPKSRYLRLPVPADELYTLALHSIWMGTCPLSSVWLRAQSLATTS